MALIVDVTKKKEDVKIAIDHVAAILIVKMVAIVIKASRDVVRIHVQKVALTEKIVALVAVVGKIKAVILAILLTA